MREKHGLKIVIQRSAGGSWIAKITHHLDKSHIFTTQIVNFNFIFANSVWNFAESFIDSTEHSENSSESISLDGPPEIYWRIFLFVVYLFKSIK